MSTSLKNQSGFGLIGVMVAAGITGIISLSVATMLNNMMKGQNAVSFRNEAENITEEVRSTLAATDACRNSMGGIVLAPNSTTDVVAVRDVLNNPVFQAATTLNTRGVRIEAMRLSEYSDLVNQTGKATLTLHYISNREVLGPREFFRAVSISTLKDAGNVLVDCMANSKGTAATDNWSLATNLNDIIYTGGNVGIGTSDAPSKLVVSGAGDVTSTVTSTNSGAAIINLIGSSTKITRPNGPFSVEAGGVNQFTILNNGNVGIGTSSATAALEVAGPGDVTSLITSGGGNVAELQMSGGSGRVTSSNGPLSLETQTADSIMMKTNNTERMSITASGAVGIGTTAPAAGVALDVKGGFIRGQMDCRLVSGPMTIMPSEANCAGDEFVMSGGMNCRDPMDYPTNGGYVHQSQPKPGLTGWIGDCYNAAYSDPQTPGQAFAICCKR